MQNFNDLSFENLPAAVSKILLDITEIRKVLLQKHKREPTHNELLSVEKTIIFLSENGYLLSKSKLYKLTSSQKIPHSKLNNKLIFNKQDLASWLELQIVKRPNNQTESVIRSAINSSNKYYNHGKR